VLKKTYPSSDRRRVAGGRRDEYKWELNLTETDERGVTDYPQGYAKLKIVLTQSTKAFKLRRSD